MAHRLVCVIGGAGFLGRHLVRRLAAAGDRVRVALRDPEAAHFLKPMGAVGQIHAVAANVRNQASLERAAAGADAVVYLVGTLVSRGKQNFQALHADGARMAATAAKAAGVKTFVHVSALGADAGSRSAYARTKAAGEAAVREAFARATILRPSVVFGPEDDFFNRFAELSTFGPAMPVPGNPRFQPVYVGDVADAIMKALDDPACAGMVYSLGGPRIYTLREIIEMVLANTERRRAVIGIPLWLAAIQAAFLQFLPNPPLTPDQVRLLALDNIVPPGEPGLSELGIAPTAAEAIVPSYLQRFHNPYGPHRPTAQQTGTAP